MIGLLRDHEICGQVSPTVHRLSRVKHHYGKNKYTLALSVLILRVPLSFPSLISGMHITKFVLGKAMNGRPCLRPHTDTSSTEWLHLGSRNMSYSFCIVCFRTASSFRQRGALVRWLPSCASPLASWVLPGLSKPSLAMRSTSLQISCPVLGATLQIFMPSGHQLHHPVYPAKFLVAHANGRCQGVCTGM